MRGWFEPPDRIALAQPPAASFADTGPVSDNERAHW
jgi:hypothetical protein